MVGWSEKHRYRKYARRVSRAFRSGRNLDWLLTLKWRYWHKLYGPHLLLWKEGGE